MKRADEVLHSVETFADTRFKVDQFKAESPLPAEQVPTREADAAAPDAAANACSRAFAALHTACAGRPWVMLSAGASAPAFERGR